MKKIRVAINGFGRIGRIATRAILRKSNLELVAINDLADTATLAHLFKYDSVQGKFQGQVTADATHLFINGNPVQVFARKDHSTLPWKDLNIDVVLESTGLFLTVEEAGRHISAGAKKVVISAPPKGKGIKTVVIGINEDTLDGTEKIISNASCTTNCSAPMVKILDELWRIEEGFLSTIHAFTSDQRLHDSPHKDLRRARAASLSIIPTTTGAARAIARIFPHLAGKLDGMAFRVPVPSGSLTDFTCILKKPASKEEINKAFKEYAEGSFKGILEYSEEPLVSTDIVGNPYSCIFDSQLTSSSGRMIKVVGWYDNEAGYSHRIADLIEKVG